MHSRGPSFYERLFQKLNTGKVRYLVVGGMEAILYGVGRPKDLADIRELRELGKLHG